MSKNVSFDLGPAVGLTSRVLVITRHFRAGDDSALRVRHKALDFRNTTEEVQATREIAQWTIDVNCELRGQKAKVVQWEPE